MRVWKANPWLSFIYLEADNNPCRDGGPYSESTPQIIKVKQAQGYLPDIRGVGFTSKNCDHEYEGILLEYRYLLLLHAFQQPALTQILHEPSLGA
jgi:hypothetical protein